MKRLLYSSLFILHSSLCCAQLLPFQDEDDIITPSFNYSAIHAKKISGITIHNFTKLSGSSITDAGIASHYSFDTAGRLTKSCYATKISPDKWDTIQTVYYYNMHGNLIIKRTAMGDFFDTWYYTWNDLGQMKREAHVHETKNSTNPALAGTGIEDFKIATQRVISSDSFAYILYPKQIQQYAYNEDNIVFQKTITQFDENKRVISRNKHYSVGWLYSEVDMEYDNKGRIVKFTVTGNINGDKNNSTTLQYDSLGNIVSEGIWVDGKQTHHIEFMYDQPAGLITNKLDMETKSELISIVKFGYELFN